MSLPSSAGLTSRWPGRVRFFIRSHHKSLKELAGFPHDFQMNLFETISEKNIKYAYLFGYMTALIYLCERIMREDTSLF